MPDKAEEHKQEAAVPDFARETAFICTKVGTEAGLSLIFCKKRCFYVHE